MLKVKLDINSSSISYCVTEANRDNMPNRQQTREKDRKMNQSIDHKLLCASKERS